MVVLEELYRIKHLQFMERLGEQVNPRIIYVTDLVACSHKRIMRTLYPLLSFRLEPAMILGDLAHTGLAQILTNNSISKGKWVAEVEVERQYVIDGITYKLKGRADLVYYENDKPVAVVEVKTSRSMQKNEPLVHHMLQLQIYLNLLNVERGFILYITPDKLVEYPVERANIDIEALIKETINNTRRPRFDWECSYCPFNKICPYAVTKQEKSQEKEVGQR